MFGHVYPPWHRPVQRALSVLAVVLCIALPLAYGRRPRRISARTMGLVFGLYFGFWILFSLIVRFFVPSPKVESTLPTYDPSPIPVPVLLHSPSRASAVPVSPAIKLHPATPTAPGAARAARETHTGIEAQDPPTAVTKSARFADLPDGYGSDDDQVEDPAGGDHGSGAGQHKRRITNTVTFQTRPRGYTNDSSNSIAAYPTFAAYRQAQQGSHEAFAQRIKRAFMASQQAERQYQQQMEQGVQGHGHEHGSEQGQGQGQDPPPFSISDEVPTVQVLGSGERLSARHADWNGSNNSLSNLAAPIGEANRPRSTSMASILSDIADRIKGGSPLFGRSSSNPMLSRSVPMPSEIPGQSRRSMSIEMMAEPIGEKISCGVDKVESAEREQRGVRQQGSEDTVVDLSEDRTKDVI